MWGLGYAITWIAKWIILDIVKDRGIFEQAIQQKQQGGEER